MRERERADPQRGASEWGAKQRCMCEASAPRSEAERCRGASAHSRSGTRSLQRSQDKSEQLQCRASFSRRCYIVLIHIQKPHPRSPVSMTERLFVPQSRRPARGQAGGAAAAAAHSSAAAYGDFASSSSPPPPHAAAAATSSRSTVAAPSSITLLQCGSCRTVLGDSTRMIDSREERIVMDGQSTAH